jgi:ribosomal protein S12 methylthiotransferase accessory factor YcaO
MEVIMPKPEDVPTGSAADTDLDQAAIDQLAELIESNLDNVAGAAADFKKVSSHLQAG